MKTQDKFMFEILFNTIKVKALAILKVRIKRETESLKNAIVFADKEFSDSIQDKIIENEKLLSSMSFITKPEDIILSLPDMYESAFQGCLVQVIDEVLTGHQTPELKVAE